MSKIDRGKLAVLVGGQYGSEGKGAISAHLADEYAIHVRVGSPNAGHTFYDKDGNKHVMQSIPCGWINKDATIVIGRGALINLKFLMDEISHIMEYDPDFLHRLIIDSKAGILSETFQEEEGGTEGEMHRRIGSTGEGVGPARIARIQRDPEKFTLFGEVAPRLGLEDCLCRDTSAYLASMQDLGYNVMIEGTQGSALSLLHSHWPYCTSIDTNVAGIISEVGLAPSRVTDVIMVCRTYPIRVAGNSGPMKLEVSWEYLSDKLGRDVIEQTTVTKKVRRVGEWDQDLYEKACRLNEPTAIALTFCDYIDPKLHGATTMEAIEESELMQRFLADTSLLGRVKYFGTGPSVIVESED